MRPKYFGFIGCLYCHCAFMATSGIAATREDNKKPNDTIPPSIVFTAPTKGVRVPYLAWVGGWVRDNPGGNGIARVQMLLTRKTKDKTFYWGGYDWWPSDAARRAALHPDIFPENWAEYTQAQLSGSRWNYPRRLLPSRHVQSGGQTVPQIGPKLFPGLYTFRVTAYDRAGNTRSIERRVRVVPDITLPRVGFIQPHNNTLVSRFPTLEGWARDKGESGLDRVEIIIWRKSDSKEWTGREWVRWNSHQITLPAVLENGRWSLRHNLPQGAALQPGRYEIWVVAYDHAGNRSGLRYLFERNNSDGSRSSCVKDVSTAVSIQIGKEHKQ